MGAVEQADFAVGEVLVQQTGVYRGVPHVGQGHHDAAALIQHPLHGRQHLKRLIQMLQHIGGYDDIEAFCMPDDFWPVSGIQVRRVHLLTIGCELLDRLGIDLQRGHAAIRFLCQQSGDRPGAGAQLQHALVLSHDPDDPLARRVCIHVIFVFESFCFHGTSQFMAGVGWSAAYPTPGPSHEARTHVIMFNVFPPNARSAAGCPAARTDRTGSRGTRNYDPHILFRPRPSPRQDQVHRADG